MRALLPLLLLLWLAQCSSAQAPIEEVLRYDDRGWPLGSDAGAVADAAIAVWLTREPLGSSDLVGLDAAEICAALPGIVLNPPPPAGTEVRSDDRREWDRDDGDESLRSFTYTAIRPGDQLDVAQVDLRRTEEGYRVERVGFRSTGELTGMRAWLQTPPAAWLFGLGTLALLLLFALRGSPLRRAWAVARTTMAGYRRTILATMVLLGSVFLLGVGTGNTLPAGCDVAMLAIVGEAVGQIGATEAYASGNIARAAALTFYQNFVVVTFSVHFFLTMLLGFPSYLLAIPQFFLLGVPFGLLSGLTLWGWLPVVALIAIELSAYFLVISGGGIVLGSVLRRGWRSYPEALRAAASLLLPAALLLLAGAWYEAILLIGL
jgi:hypothetical protein